jgi:hypothetical protein
MQQQEACGKARIDSNSIKEQQVMKLVGVLSTAVLTFSLGIGIPAYAQEEKHDQQEENKDKPAQEKEKKAEPEKSAKQQQEDKDSKPEAKTAQEQGKPAQNEHAAGGRIPADRYKANFGRAHTFRVSQSDYSSGRFQYGGYWFGFGGAWPSNWLYTQDVYVVEINGVYYLCNPTYPGVNLMLSVTL